MKDQHPSRSREASSDAIDRARAYAPAPPIRFRLVHVLYVVALIAACLATFGAGGIALALIVAGFWAFVFLSRSRPRALGYGYVGLITLGCLFACIAPMVSVAHRAARRTQCACNMKNIAFALQNYHDVYGTFPPAYIADEDGKPMHSWRVLILPFLDEAKRYDRYDFSQPWDGPTNRKLMSPIPYVYACPSADRTSAAARQATSYVAVVGERTVWPGAEARSMREIADGTSNTILVVEASEFQIPWMKPEDPSLEDCVRLLHSTQWDELVGHRLEDFFYRYSVGRQVAVVDGSTVFLPYGLDSQQASDLLTIDDGKAWDIDQRGPTPPRQPKLDNWFRLAVLFLIVLFPTPWVWLNPQPALQRQETGRQGTRG